MTTPTQVQIETAAKEIRTMLATIGNPTPENLAYAALTAAAAEAGCGCIYPQDCADKISATIERCAQVVEKCNYWPPSPKQLAAALRALKDKP